MNENLIGQQIPTSIITAYMIEWLKHQTWFPFAKVNELWLNRVMSGIAALVTAGAIHYTFAPNGDFAFNGNLYTTIHALWAATQQYALQHVVYKIAIAPPASPVLVESKPPHDTITVEQKS